MSYPTSETAVCNLALDHLNQDSITNFESPETETEVLCKRHYDLARRSVLRMHTWNFATKRISLPKNSESPLFGYDAAYDLPNDYVRLVELGEYGFVRNYAKEGNQLLVNAVNNTTSDLNVLYLRYIHDFTTVNLMEPLFIEALALHLAIKLCMPITNNQANLERLTRMWDDFSTEAFAVDGQEDPPKRVEISRNKSARYGNRFRHSGGVAGEYTIFNK